MRVLWLVRHNLREHPGGDTVQILNTAAALERLGVTIELTADARPDFRAHDLAHLFHLDRLWENADYCRRIRAAGRPAVLSTIYWPSDEFDRAGRAGLQGLLARTLGSDAYRTLRVLQRGLLDALQRGRAHGVRAFPFSFKRCARYVLETMSVLLPNSAAERDVIARQFDVVRPAVVVPNAVDVEAFAFAGPPVGERSGVLCVGRIEPRKGQLALIRALRDTDIPLRLVGACGRFNSAYERRCRRAAGANVTFLGQRTPAELRDLYAGAAVHACVSWYETPGLASLEAGLCGCALVVTPGGSTREYFGDEVEYCEAGDPRAIRSAVGRAISIAASPQLAARIAREYTWEAAARRTLEGYELALAAR